MPALVGKLETRTSLRALRASDSHIEKSQERRLLWGKEPIVEINPKALKAKGYVRVLKAYKRRHIYGYYLNWRSQYKWRRLRNKSKKGADRYLHGLVSIKEVKTTFNIDQQRMSVISAGKLDDIGQQAKELKAKTAFTHSPSPILLINPKPHAIDNKDSGHGITLFACARRVEGREGEIAHEMRMDIALVRIIGMNSEHEHGKNMAEVPQHLHIYDGAEAKETKGTAIVSFHHALEEEAAHAARIAHAAGATRITAVEHGKYVPLEVVEHSHNYEEHAQAEAARIQARAIATTAHQAGQHTGHEEPQTGHALALHNTTAHGTGAIGHVQREALPHSLAIHHPSRGKDYKRHSHYSSPTHLEKAVGGVHSEAGISQITHFIGAGNGAYAQSAPAYSTRIKKPRMPIQTAAAAHPTE